MPVIQYFLITGSLLFALLFAADNYLPQPIGRASATDVDRTTIRIHSARSLPERIVFDTASPAVEPPSAPRAAELPEDRPREAFAMMAESGPRQIRQVAATTRLADRQRAGRPRRAAPMVPQRRLAFDRRELFGGW